jgi:hypothetical protein
MKRSVIVLQARVVEDMSCNRLILFSDPCVFLFDPVLEFHVCLFEAVLKRINFFPHVDVDVLLYMRHFLLLKCKDDVDGRDHRLPHNGKRVG